MAAPNILIVGCEASHHHLGARVHAQRSSGGQNIDIRGAGVTIIRKLGLEAQIRASTTGEEGVQLVDEHNRVWSQNRVDKTGEIQMPTSDIEILRGRLAELCWKNSQRISAEAEHEGAKGIEYIFGDYLDNIEQDGSQVHVHFAKSGESRGFDLLVGADGMQSQTRKMVWGEEGEKDRLKRIGMFAGFFSIPRENRTASGDGGSMLLAGAASCCDQIAWIFRGRDKGEWRRRSPEGTPGGILQGCRMGVRQNHPADAFYYDAVSQVTMESWTKGRVVLLGDAGYCASPISGLGTTLAFSAAYKLAGYLQKYIKGETLDPSAALAQYNEQMRPIVEDGQELAPGQPYIINPETAWGVWVMRVLIRSLSYTRIIFFVVKFFGKVLHLGPQAADYVQVEDFGFKEMSVWKEEDTDKPI
ncbi:hypothetical protein N7486_006344 [Penicillium sp. IBT 16267x]|nr:hypothetical protein N7486_006344 [Penicillium sp. IBT 16267x]